MEIDFGSLIPIAGILASVGFAWVWLRYQQVKLQARQLERDAGEQADEKRQLLQRLAVLERIATDRGLQTAEQIEALREQPEIATSDGKGRI